jgi:peptidoglycan/LPS O-acetylase OafA/YrhL
VTVLPSRSHIMAIAVVVIASIIGWAAPLLYRVDIGQWDEAVVTSFYDSEYGAGTTFRWSEPRATLQLPAVGAGAYVVRLHASALAATALDITLQNTTHTVLVQPGFAYYDVAVQVPIGWSDALSVTVAVAQPQVVARRSIGVALDEVRVIPSNWQIPAWHGVWWTLLATLVLTHLLRFWRIAWVWRWLAAAALTMAVVVLRHGNAATILELLAMLGSLAIACAHCVRLTRRQQLGVVVLVVTMALLVLWWRGTSSWSPLWQFAVLLGSATLLRLRRFVWRPVRPWRHLLLVGAFVGMASQAWLLAGLSLVIGVMYVVGKRVDPNRGMVFACLYAGYSLFPLLDAWLCGRGMPRGPQKQLLRYIGLDYLRGVAMFLVLVTHMPTIVAYTPMWFFDTVAWMGKISVDAFFILSGWLIGGLIINEISHWQSTRALGLFLHRRWARTIPIYWYMLVIVALGGWGGATLAGLNEYFVFVQNMWHDHPPYLLVAWSLSIEEWFYLVTALGISLLTRWFAPTRALLVTLILLLVVPTMLRSYVALSTTLSWNDVLRQYVPLRLDVIGTGVAMVWWWRTWVHTHPMRAVRLAVLSTVLSVVYLGLLAWFQPDIERDAWVRVTLIPVTVLALALWYPWLASLTRTQLSWLGRWVQWIAWISYPLYLLHYPWRLTLEGLVGAIGRNTLADVVVTVGYVVGSIWLAGRWHVELEQPIMNLRLRT